KTARRTLAETARPPHNPLHGPQGTSAVGLPGPRVAAPAFSGVFAMGVLELNRDKWKEFKNKHDFSKSSFFSKADVGPTIDKFQDAVARFQKTRAQKDLMSAFKKAQDLQKAFAKFIQ